MRIFLPKIKSFRLRVTLFLVAAMLLSAFLGDFLIYDFARETQFKQLQERLKQLARTAALMVDPAKLEAIPLVPQGMATPEFQETARILSAVKNANPAIKYIYVMKKTSDDYLWQFWVDPNATAEDSAPGNRYDIEPFPWMRKAFSQPIADPRLKRDSWGVFLSAYAPVRKADGTAEAVLGVDMSADDVHAIQREVSRRAFLVLLIGILFSLVAAALISRKVTERIKELSAGTRHIANGNLRYRIQVSGSDEISSLADSFNEMAKDLGNHIEQLKRTTAAKERIESELKIAHEIQASILPRVFPPFPDRWEFEVFASMDPAKEVGGDFYDFFLVDKDKLCFLIGDVSDKGVPAALFMMISRTLLKNQAMLGLSPVEVLSRVNEIIVPDNNASMFVTVLCMVLDIKSGEVQCANAGHNPPLLCTAGEGFQYLEMPKGFVVGAMPSIKFEPRSFALKPGETLFLYTDGVTEATDTSNRMFGEGRLKNCLDSLKEEGLPQMINGVRSGIDIFTAGASRSDDITMLALRYHGYR